MYRGGERGEDHRPKRQRGGYNSVPYVAKDRATAIKGGRGGLRGRQGHHRHGVQRTRLEGMVQKVLLRDIDIEKVMTRRHGGSFYILELLVRIELTTCVQIIGNIKIIRALLLRRL